MKKEETKIATNVSSGAEKVEIVEKEVKKSRTGSGTKKQSTAKTQKTVSAKGDAALGDSTAKKAEKSVNAKKMNSEMDSQKAEKESKAAKERVQIALKKKEEQAKHKEEKAKKKAEKVAARKKRIAEKKAEIEKRMAQRKALIEKRAAERKARAEKRAAEREKEIRERAHAKANKTQARSKKKSEKARGKSNKQRESREKGYGGWIAAVVALGVTTLALATTVTVGAVEMSKVNEGMIAANRGTMYELTGVMEHVDDDLDRVRISASPAQQSRILTDILVQVRLAEADLEKLPISINEGQNVTVFINRTAMECERMLAKLRNGETLSQQDMSVLDSLYKTNHSIRQELDQLVENMTDKDLTAYMKGNGGMIGETLNRLESMTLEENRAAFDGKKMEMKGADTQSTENAARIDGAQAAELCKNYFSKYSIDEFQCVGETSTRGYSAYNMQGYDDKGTMLFAEISQKDGALIGFDYYEECTAENFNLENAERIAEEFLETLGYEDMELVRNRNMGTTAEFTFVYEDDGVVYYPDEVRVKVCRTRGVVTGMDARKYLKNHKEREDVEVKINLASAQDKLSDKVTIEASRLAVVHTARGERAAYEFLCMYEDVYYFIYLDAVTGSEIAIINAQNVL